MKLKSNTIFDAIKKVPVPFLKVPLRGVAEAISVFISRRFLISQSRNLLISVFLLSSVPIILILSTPVVLNATEGAMVYFSSSTGSGPFPPSYSTSTASGFDGTETKLSMATPQYAGVDQTGHWLVSHNPNTTESFLMTFSGSGSIYQTQYWNGTSWQITGSTACWKAGTGAAGVKHFDFTYFANDSTYKRGIAVYYRSSAPQVAYRIWYSTAGTIDNVDRDTGMGARTYRWIRLEPIPGTNKVVLVALSATAGQRIISAVFDLDTGTWGAEKVLGDATAPDSTTMARSFDLAVENSGKAMAVWVDTNNATSLSYSTWTAAGDWAASPMSVGYSVTYSTRSQWVRLVTKPNANEIQLAFNYFKPGSTTPQLAVAIWDGTTWGNGAFISGNTTGSSQQRFDINYERQSGDCLIAFSSSTFTPPSYATRASGGLTFSNVAQATDFGAGAQGQWYRLVREVSATSDDIYLIANGADSSVRWQKWGGASWGAVTTVETNSLSTRQSFDMAIGNLTSAVDTTPPAAISDLTGLTGINDGDVILSWTAPGDDGMTSNISGGQYDLRYSTNAIGNETNFSNIPANYRIVKPTETVPSQPYSLTVTGLNPGTSYYFALKYRDESNNWASWSTGTYTNTASTSAAQDLLPNAVVTSTAVGGDTFISLTWTYPAVPAGVNDYDKFWVYRSSASFTEPERNDSGYVHVAATFTYLLGYPTTSFVDIGLTNLTTYYYHISLFDKGDQGQGLYSVPKESFSVVEVSTIPWLAPPSAPTGFTGIAQSTYSIKWSWTDAGGGVGYRVRYATSPYGVAVSSILPSVSAFWIEDILSANSSYCRVVVATNSTGESQLSNAATAYTLARPPTNLVFPTNTCVGYSSATFQWNVNDNPSWTRYSVAKSTTDTFDGPAISTFIVFADNFTGNTTTAFGLSAETTYYFRVWAYNEVSTMTAYIQSSTTTKVGPPTAPSNLKISSLLGGTTAIYWQFDDNSTNETGLYLSSGSDTAMHLSGNLADAAFTGTTYWAEVGLSTNTQYTRFAEANNANGSVWSVSITSYTAAAPPASPSATTNNSTSINLTWNANDNPSPATKYGVKYATATDFYVSTTAVNFASGLTATTTIVYYLSANTTYYFSVWAYNGDRIETAYASPVSTMTMPQASNTWANHIVISQITAGTDAAGNEFVELYNPTNNDIDLKNLPSAGGILKLRTETSLGVLSSKTIAWGANSTIPAYGYFLFVAGILPAGNATPDATYSASIGVSNGVMITDAASVKIDGIAQNAGNVNSIEGTLVSSGGLASGKSYERKPNSPNGCGYDSDNNDADYTFHSTYRFAKNSSSAPEQPPDTLPPAGISDLTALTGSDDGQIILQWTSPGDDGTVGNLTGVFEIKYSSTGIINSSNYDSPPAPSYTVTITTTSLQPLTACTTTIYNLLGNNVLYYFAIKTRDEISTNWSVWTSSANDLTVNTSAYATVVNVTPDNISDLTALTGSDDGQIILQWTSPGDDGTVGTLNNAAFEIKYSSTDIISNSNYGSVSAANTIVISTSSLLPLTACSRVVTGLLGNNVLYHFAIKARDEISTNWSVWKSTADAPFTQNTSAYAYVQTVPPNNISDLTALTGTNDGEVNLRWTAPGDDGTVGNVSGGEYRVAYSTNPIGNDTDFSNATIRPDVSTNTVTREPYSTIVTGLNPGTSYYFALKYRDEVASNWAGWSTGTFVNTLSYAAAYDVAPNEPTAVTVVSSNTAVNIWWTNSTLKPGNDDIEKYWVYRATFTFATKFDGNVVLCSTTNYPALYSSSNPLHITSLTNGVTYYFRIVAVDKGDQLNGLYSIALESGYSSAVSTAPFIAPPVLVSANYAGSNINLVWTHSPDFTASNFSSYRIYYSIVSGGPYTLAGSTSTGTSYTDPIVSPRTQKAYYYVLTTRDTDGVESIYSNEKVANPDTVPPTVTHTLVTEINVLGGYAIFVATITDTDNNGSIQPVTSAKLYYQLTGGSWIEVSTATNIGDLYTFKIGPIGAAFLVDFKYYIEAKDVASNYGYIVINGDTKTAATAPTVDVKTQTAVITLTAGGGTLTVSDGDQTDGETSVTIPAGALATNVPIAILQEGYPGDLTPPPSAFKNENTSTIASVSTAPIVCFDFTPDNTHFKKPIILTIRYLDQNSDGEIDDRPGILETNLRIYYWDNWEWRYIGGTVDTVKNTVSGYVDHFTLFAVFPKGAIPVKPTASEKFVTPATVDGKNDIAHFICDSNIVKIEIYDVTGKKIRTVDGNNQAYLDWDGKDDDGNVLESGVYIYKVEAVSGEKRTGAVVLAK
ncbi:MAG: fibronectin type III domain-containing protein [Elusimicrobiota bacterium]